RHAGHHVREEPQDRRQTAVLAVLLQVDGTEDAEGHRHQRGEAGGEDGANDGRSHSGAGSSDGRDVLSEEVPGDRLGPLLNHRDENEPERDEHDDEGQSHQDRRDPVPDGSPGSFRAEVGRRHLRRRGQGRGHSPRVLLIERFTMARAERFTMIVMMNGTTPSPIKAARQSPELSPNSLAMTAGMEYPGANRLAVICGLEPITRAAAIVSPMARPRPRVTAPTTPPLLWEKTD